MNPCWWCGAPSRWQCQRCGSTEQRPKGKGCAECHRRHARARTRRQAEDIVITPAIRNYLEAFTRYLMAGKTGDTALIRRAARDKARALHTLENNR